MGKWMCHLQYVLLCTTQCVAVSHYSGCVHAVMEEHAGLQQLEGTGSRIDACWHVTMRYFVSMAHIVWATRYASRRPQTKDRCRWNNRLKPALWLRH
jgi:hypothetical protein